MGVARLHHQTRRRVDVGASPLSLGRFVGRNDGREERVRRREATRVGELAHASDL